MLNSLVISKINIKLIFLNNAPISIGRTSEVCFPIIDSLLHSWNSQWVQYSNDQFISMWHKGVRFTWFDCNPRYVGLDETRHFYLPPSVFPLFLPSALPSALRLSFRPPFSLSSIPVNFFNIRWPVYKASAGTCSQVEKEIITQQVFCFLKQCFLFVDRFCTVDSVFFIALKLSLLNQFKAAQYGSSALYDWSKRKANVR